MPSGLNQVSIVESQIGPHSDQSQVPPGGVPSQLPHAVGEPNLSMPFPQHESVPTGVSPFQPNFTFAQHNESVDWHQQDGSDQHPLTSPYWASAETTPSRPNFSPNPLANLTPQQSYHGNQPWPPPVRSASFSQIEGNFGNYGYVGSRHGSEYGGLPIHSPIETHSGSLSSASLTQDGSISSGQHFGQQEARPVESLPTSDFQAQWVPSSTQGHWYGEAEHLSNSDANARGITPISYPNIPPNYYVNSTHPG